jgi:sRNA-binding protein
MVCYSAKPALSNASCGGLRGNIRIPFVTRAKSPHISAAAYTQLNAAFPLAFPLNDAEIRPLTVTIRDDLSAWMAAQPDSGAFRHLLGAMQRHCSRETYQHTVITGAMRINLAGEPVEAVTPAGQAHAESRIAAILAARAETAPPKPKPQPKAPPKPKAQPLSVSLPPAQPVKAQAMPTVTFKKRRTVVRPD